MLENLDLRASLARDDFKRRLGPLRRWLLQLQRAYWHEGLSALIAFEGWDTAGKGNAIRTLTRRLEPRGYEIHPIRAPRTSEQQMPWLWRFWMKVPPYGSLAIFDRSWYGRVLVERVEGIVDEDWYKTYRQINDFERMLADDRFVIVKFFLHISKDEQRRRFDTLQADPLTAWQVEPEDWDRHEKYDQYLHAVEDMLAETETEWAPWHIVASTDRYWSQMTVLETVAECLEFGLVSRGLPLPEPDEPDEAEVPGDSVDSEEAAAESPHRQEVQP